MQAHMDNAQGRGLGRAMHNDRFGAPDEVDARRIDNLFRIISEFRKREPKMTSSMIHAFLVVARFPGNGPVFYADKMGTTQPVASRNLLELGQKARTREASLDLVDSRPDPSDLRAHQYFLTNKGRKLYNDIMKILVDIEMGGAKRQ